MIPFIPLLLGGASVLAAAHGVKKGVEAKEDMDLAKYINEQAQKICKEADASITNHKESTTKSIESLGAKKVELLSHSVNDFVTNFGKIRNIDPQNSIGMDELRHFNPKSPEFLQLKKISFEAADVAVNGITSLGSGALLALGTYNVVMGGLGGLLVTATTGTALSSLTGVAATNATLAWLGGGALSVGGLGMAGGMAVLGGIVAGPALALGGSLFAAKAEKAYYAARENQDKAKEYQEEANSINATLDAIKSRADQMNNLLGRLNAPLNILNAKMKSIINSSGTDWRYYTPTEKNQIYKCVQTASAIKKLLDTSLLHEDGSLNQASAGEIASSQRFLNQLNV